MSDIIKSMSSDKMLDVASFCAGFAWSTASSPANLLVAPISTTIVGSISGAFACFGTKCISDFIPDHARPILVTGLFGSAVLYTVMNVYSDYKKIKHYD